MRWLSTVAHADEGKLVIEKMRLDDTGFPQPTGEFEELSADCLVLALGQDADLAVLDGVPGVTFSGGTVDVGPSLMTGHQGIFAGGDVVPDERTVTVAVGHGNKAARAIDAWLSGTGRGTPPRHDLAGYDGLNTWYYADAPAAVRPVLAAARRIGTFDEVTGGLDASTALFEARRCMSCGNCFDCDNCYGSCRTTPSSSCGQASTRSTTSTAKAAASAPRNAPAARSPWCPRRPRRQGRRGDR
jgi:hypothetical protein